MAMSKTAMIREYFTKHPDARPIDVAESFGVTRGFVSNVKRSLNMDSGKMIRFVPRERDNLLLEVIKRKRAGHTINRIARDLGQPVSTITNAPLAVLRADIAESGEPEGCVRAGYW